MTKILLVDDEAVLRETVEAILVKLGFEVVGAENGRQGLEVFEREEPDIIILDLEMPVLNGLGMLEGMKQFPDLAKKTLVIILTGSPTFETTVEAIHLGAFEYLEKPFAIKRLQEVINMGLAKIASKQIDDDEFEQI